MKQNYARLIVVALSTIIQANIAYGQPQNSIPLVDKATLGGELFFDPDLSLYQNQSCSTCHSPKHAFIDPRKNQANGIASEGSDGHSFGNRNTPTASYAQFSPLFHFDEKTGEYVGGQFWDGRAIDLADQAGGPPLNPVEMAMPNKNTVIERLKTKPFYYENFIHLYGKNVWDTAESAYSAMADAISQYEKTDFFAPFDAKYDRYLRGEYELTLLEDLGRTLFFSNNNLKCKECHSLDQREDRIGETFTNYQYHNIGVPSNPELIALNHLPPDYKDAGLADNPYITDPVEKEKQRGKFKVPSLRNVAVTAPYMHNGVFKDLRTVILFYDRYNNPQNTINPETGKPWRQPEFPNTLSIDKLLAKKLNDRKIDALVAFLETLTDKRYEPLLEQQKKAKASEKQPIK
ncbi:methylamine utilization protein MauG [Mergibacter septicus]|uniref:Methylamine utilization protein MauG n=1 Tax=Mergibacter septicus TaxID=221402 RepID=A0A8D4LMG6_9PAST|nr:cytochrome c peroxidase [Mergibacter septicus]AWX15772.1 methylamine utilization protein MauG [Mergibacter septicus]QDJ15025.1 methylamine utilization protein MauG [Mergibacter septicus]UTU47550.1 c-type cytochrome [Mergibacter septicus]WMR95268.1 cytochrome c peroxidase [Mergibacter septicus]